MFKYSHQVSLHPSVSQVMKSWASENFAKIIAKKVNNLALLKNPKNLKLERNSMPFQDQSSMIEVNAFMIWKIAIQSVEVARRFIPSK